MLVHPQLGEESQLVLGSGETTNLIASVQISWLSFRAQSSALNPHSRCPAKRTAHSCQAPVWRHTGDALKWTRESQMLNLRRDCRDIVSKASIRIKKHQKATFLVFHAFRPANMLTPDATWSHGRADGQLLAHPCTQSQANHFFVHELIIHLVIVRYRKSFDFQALIVDDCRMMADIMIIM